MNTRSERLPLILVPGFGADRRLFDPQVEVLGNTIAVDWIEPEPGESLAHYALRLARLVDPRRPCYVGGYSLGGILALEMSRLLPARGCFLISSLRRPEELPRLLRLLKPLVLAIPRPLGERLAGLPGVLARTLLALGSHRMSPSWRAVLRQLAARDRRFLWWAAQAILRWKAPEDAWPVPIYQIHGDRDALLPLGRNRVDRVVSGGTHLMVRQKPAEVIRFLDARMAGG